MGELLATISSAELTEWPQYFAWKAERDEEDQEFKKEVRKAEAWVNERK